MNTKLLLRGTVLRKSANVIAPLCAKLLIAGIVLCHFRLPAVRAVAPPPVELIARSAGDLAGFGLGYVEILRDGQQIYYATGGAGGGRGVTIARFTATGDTIDIQNFDTWGDPTAKGRVLVYLQTAAPGEIIFVLLGDDGGLAVWDQNVLYPDAEPLITALESVGARQLRLGGYRDSWVMGAVVGQGQAFAEQVGKGLLAEIQAVIPSGGSSDAPLITRQPVARTVGIGDRVSFSVSATSLTQMSYVWTHNGSDVPNETNAVLRLARVESGDAGSYSVKIRNAGGETLSDGVELKLVNNGSADSVVDNGAPQLGRAFQVVQMIEQPDGKRILLGYDSGSAYRPLNVYLPLPIELLRINADGTPDPSFQARQFGAISARLTLACRKNGKILVGGFFDFVDSGKTNSNLVQFNEDGTTDPSFTLTFATRSDEYYNSPWVSGVTSLPDDSILVAGHFAEVNGVRRVGLVKLNSSGEVDDGWDAGFIDGAAYSQIIQSSEKIIVIAGNPFGLPLGGLTYDHRTFYSIVRLLNDGQRDTNFVDAVFSSSIETIALAPNDGFFLAGDLRVQPGAVTTRPIQRFNADGSVDSGFDASATPFGRIRAIAPEANGRVVVAGDFTRIGDAHRTGLARFKADGTLDLTFNAAQLPNGNVDFLYRQRDGRILASGLFSVFDWSPSPGTILLRGSSAAPVLNRPVQKPSFSTSFETDFGLEYILEHAEQAAGPWIDSDRLVGTGMSVTFTSQIATAGSGFYRIRLN